MINNKETMTARLGDVNQRVAEVQRLLSLVGYDLVSDGHFGPRTLRSVKAFQKKTNITVDGVVGPITFNALTVHASQKRVYKEERGKVDNSIFEELNINKSHRLSSGQYIKQKTDKTQLFLHFTASSGNARNVIDHWDSSSPRVATSYVIAGDGEVFECFHPDYWAFHLGIKGTNGRLDKTSIGIEICNYGPLKLKGGKFYAWPRNYSQVVIPENKVYKLNRSFRGYQYFESFNQSQIESTEKLCEKIIEKYNIKVQPDFDDSWFDFDKEVISKTLPGIWSHSTVRKDKSDVYPDHRILNMLKRLSEKYGK